MRIALHHDASVATGRRLTGRPSCRPLAVMGILRRAGIVAAVAAAPVGLAYRFALAYRVRAGYPRPNPPHVTPDVLGLPYETTTVPSGGLDLPAWFIPARDGAPGPGSSSSSMAGNPPATGRCRWPCSSTPRASTA